MGVSYKEYQKIVRKRAWEKLSTKYGMWGIIVPMVVAIFISLLYWYIFREGWATVITGLAVLGVFFIIFAVFYLGFFQREHVYIHNTQDSDISNLKSQIKDIQSRNPVIHAINPKVEPKGFVNNQLRDAVSIEIVNTARGTTAEKVLPMVTWLTMRGKLVTNNQGRWWISNEDLIRLSNAEKQVMDILSNGTAYRFHFAIQSDTKEKFFTWSRAKNGREERFDLFDKKYKVNIHFQSNNNAEADFSYIVENNDGKLSIKEVNKPKKKGRHEKDK